MKLTLTSNADQPVIRVDNFNAGSPVYGSIEFTAEDLRQLNAFAATCPMFMVRDYPEQCMGCGGSGCTEFGFQDCRACSGTGVTK